MGSDPNCDLYQAGPVIGEPLRVRADCPGRPTDAQELQERRVLVFVVELLDSVHAVAGWGLRTVRGGTREMEPE